MKLEFHQLDRRYEPLRVRHPQRQRQLLASLAASGQQTPIVVVAMADEPDRYLVVDGYKRIAALEQLGRDTVEVVLWPLSEVQALVLVRALRWSQPDSALEEGWLLAELEQRFGYGLEELARQFDRSVSWVSRRLALVEMLPDSVQQQVRTGEIPAQVAMKYLVPVARASLEDCQQMAVAFARHKFTSRQAGQLYAAWREASPRTRQRLLEQPQLFLKVQQEVEPPAAASPLQELLRDLEMVAAIAQRANRRLRRLNTECEPLEEEQNEQLRHSLALALQGLQRLAANLPELKPGKEEHVESTSTNCDSGTARSGSEETRDCPLTGHLRLSVRKVLRSNSAQVPVLQRAEKAEPYRQQIPELLPRCKRNLVRVHEELIASGAVLSYQALTAFCRRHGLTEPPQQASGQYLFSAAEELQHDTSSHEAEVAGRNAKCKPPRPCCATRACCFFKRGGASSA